MCVRNSMNSTQYLHVVPLSIYIYINISKRFRPVGRALCGLDSFPTLNILYTMCSLHTAYTMCTLHRLCTVDTRYTLYTLYALIVHSVHTINMHNVRIVRTLHIYIYNMYCI